MYYKRIVSVFVALLCFGGEASAGPLVYTPVNPMFGGSPGNANMLALQLSSNKKFKERTQTLSDEEQFLKTIRSSLTQQITSQILTDIGNNAQAGSYQIGDALVTYVTEGDFIAFTYHYSNGTSTTVRMPNPNAI